MKPTILLSALLLPATASAAVTAYEGFDLNVYNESSGHPTDNLVGQGTGSGSNFSGNWVEGSTFTANTGGYWLTTNGNSSASNYVRADASQNSYTTGSNSLVTTPGQAIYQTSLNTPNRVSIQRNYNSGSETPDGLFISSLITIDGSAGVSVGFTMGTLGRPFRFGFQEDGKLFAQGYATNTSASVSFDTFTPGTYFVVVKLVNDTVGFTNDAMHFWINPDLDTSLGTADYVFDHAATGNTANLNFFVPNNVSHPLTGVVLDFDSSGSNTGSTAVDELRIGATYASVSPIPEPTSLSLLAFAVGCGLLKRRR